MWQEDVCVYGSTVMEKRVIRQEIQGREKVLGPLGTWLDKLKSSSWKSLGNFWRSLCKLNIAWYAVVGVVVDGARFYYCCHHFHECYHDWCLHMLLFMLSVRQRIILITAGCGISRVNTSLYDEAEERFIYSIWSVLKYTVLPQVLNCKALL